MWCFVYYSGSMGNLTVSFFFNDTATTEIYTLSLHDALPISPSPAVCCSELPCFCRTGWYSLAFPFWSPWGSPCRSEEHTSELQSRQYIVCRLLIEKIPSSQFNLCRILLSTYTTIIRLTLLIY